MTVLPMKPEISVVIPIYNEEQGLQALFDRLYPALDALHMSYEVVFINDGSRDNSVSILAEQFRKRPDVTRVVLFNGNYGQHMAILAGFEASRGEIMVTLDADLQNPPEEIKHLVAKMREGYDYVGSIRRKRQDSAWRTYASKAMNQIRERITNIKITDQGNMLRAYHRNVIDLVNQCGEVNTFVPALAYRFARKPTEIIVEHEERAAGESKYSLYSLIRLNFDLVTGFSLVPLQFFSMLGMGLSIGSGLLVLVLLVRRLFLGAEAEGLFTLFAIAFFFMGVILFGIGLLGEYVGRIFQQVRRVRATWCKPSCSKSPVKIIWPTPTRWKNVRWRADGRPTQTRRRLRLPQCRRALPESAAGRRRGRATGGDPRGQPERKHLVRIGHLGMPGARYPLRDAARRQVGTTAGPGQGRPAGPDLQLLLPPHAAGHAVGSGAGLQYARFPAAGIPRPRAHQLGRAARRRSHRRDPARDDRQADAGAIVSQMEVPILPDDTAFEVFNKVTVAAEQALWRVLPSLLAGTAARLHNDLSKGGYFGGRKPEDGRIDWNLPAQQVYNLHRAVAPPYPGAFTDVDGVRYILQRARMYDKNDNVAFASLPPGLAVVDNCIFGVCGDGRMLAISALTADGEAITAAQLQDRLARLSNTH